MSHASLVPLKLCAFRPRGRGSEAQTGEGTVIDQGTSGGGQALLPISTPGDDPFTTECIMRPRDRVSTWRIPTPRPQNQALEAYRAHGENLHLLPVALVGLVHVPQQALHGVGSHGSPGASPGSQLQAGGPLQQPEHTNCWSGAHLTIRKLGASRRQADAKRLKVQPGGLPVGCSLRIPAMPHVQSSVHAGSEPGRC